MPSPRATPTSDAPAGDGTQDRALLTALSAGPRTGDALAEAQSVTRAAIWKRIDALREAGIAIEAQAGQGYRLAAPLDLLDAAAIRAGLPATVQRDLHALAVAWAIDSTSSELLRRPAPPAGVDVLLAERQTAGRGRRGRAWASPLAANLYLSAGRAFGGGLARLGGLSLVAGVAAVEALRALGVTAVGLKWPNDLVVAVPGGGLQKLGGLLVEGGGEHAGPVRAVVGLGLNVRMPARGAAAIDQPWTDLAALGAGVPRNALATALLAHWLPAFDAFDRDGLAPFLPRFAACDVLAGRGVEVIDGSRRLAGEALGVADDGALAVRIDGAVRHVHAGEVSLRLPGDTPA